MKIIFVMRAAVPIHSYRDVVRALCRRGHTVEALYDWQWFGVKLDKKVQALERELPAFRAGEALHRSDGWRWIVFPARQLASWRRYFFVRQSLFFRDRWLRLFPSWLRVLVHVPLVQSFMVSKWGGVLLERIENVVGPDARILAQLREKNPDAVVVPVANMRYGAVDMDYFKAARAIAVPIVALNMSWDSLTTKGLIQIMPDVMLAWNETQIAEAREHHHIPPERIRIVGAPVFDKWLRPLQPTERATFCALHGLCVEDPILLYVGASKNIAQDEVWLVREVRSALDASTDPRLQKMQLIVRPHPGNALIYDSLRLARTIILPSGGSLPDTSESQQLFYDCLTHAVTAVGLYTSAMIDAVVVGRPAIALLRAEYRDTQQDAQYFREFFESGALASAATTAECCAFLQQLLDGRDAWKDARKRFVERFIWPRGVERTASEVAAAEIEAAATRGGALQLAHPHHPSSGN